MVYGIDPLPTELQQQLVLPLAMENVTGDANANAMSKGIGKRQY